MRYRFDTAFGRIDQIWQDGTAMLNAPAHVELWKAHGYNQLERADERRSASMECALQQTYGCDVQTNDTAVFVTCRVALGGASVVPVLKGDLTFTFTGDGAVTARMTLDKRPLSPMLPRLAFALELRSGFEQMCYYGCGPIEAYPDRHKACRIASFETTVSDNFVHYIRPFENGAHFGTRCGAVRNESGIGLQFEAESPFIFNATHCPPHLLEDTLHDDELKPLAETFVYLDCNMDINGGRGYFEKAEPERKWDDSHIDFAVRIAPLA